jgi:hypothetical protein
MTCDTINQIDALYASLSDGAEIPAYRREQIEAELEALKTQATVNGADVAPGRETGVELSAADARRFVTAGKAIFTVGNPKGQHYTFKVTAKADQHAGNPPVYFVSLLTGPQNTSDYDYLGMFNPATADVLLTKKSRFTEQAESVKVVRWALRQVCAGRALPAGYTFQHAGRCGRCGRLLTTPESITIGIGPECLGKL